MSGTQQANSSENSQNNSNIPDTPVASSSSTTTTTRKETPTTPLCDSAEEYQNNPCLDLLSKAGIVFLKNEGNKKHFATKSNLNELEQKIESLLKKSLDRGEQFVSSIREYITTETSNLLCFIEPLYVGNHKQDGNMNNNNDDTMIVEDMEDENSSDNNNSNDKYEDFTDGGNSLFRTLLKFETVQTDLIDVLLETMVICAADDGDGSDGDENNNSINNNNGKNMTKIILSQLQWIEHVYNNRQLANKLLECLDICPIESQRDIIAMIPDIIDDDEQESVVEKLFEIMENEITLTVSVLDSISNLYLSDVKKEEATERVLNMLASSSIEDLPIILRFLISGCNEDNTTNILNMIRKHLSRLIDITNTNRGMIVQDGDERSSSESLLLEAFRSSLRYRQDVVIQWLKLLEQSSVNTQLNPLCTIDIWVLVSLHSTKSYQGNVEKLLKKKASVVDGLPNDFIKRVLTGHSTALTPLFSNFLDVASSFFYVRTGAKTGQYIRAVGESLYATMFSEFSSDYHRQEIVGSLITHIGSGVNYEIQSALKTMEGLVIDAQLCKGLKKFTAFIRGLLDYVEYLSTEQQRSVFNILTSLSLPSSYNGTVSTASGSIDEITIIIRKMLASTVQHIKKVGIVGGVAILCVVSSTEKAFANDFGSVGGSQSSMTMMMNMGSQSSQSHTLRDTDGQDSPFSKLTLDMLRMLQDNCSKSSGDMNSMSIFYEELALVISTKRYGKFGLSKALLNILMDTFSSRLENQCFLDIPNDDLSEESNTMNPDDNASRDDEDKKNDSNNSSTTMRKKKKNRGNDDESNLQTTVTYYGGSVIRRFELNLDLNHAQVAVNILPLFANRRLNDDNNVWSMCPLFRLISVLEMEVNGDLSGVDACLGCPLALFDDSILRVLGTKSYAVKDLICNSLFVAVNWVREMLNSFVKELDMEMRSKIFLRGNHLLNLESKLRIAIGAHPTYRPPPSAVNMSSMGGAKRKRNGRSGMSKKSKGNNGNGRKMKPKKKIKPKKKKKKDINNDEEDDDDDDDSDDEDDDDDDDVNPQQNSSTITATTTTTTTTTSTTTSTTTAKTAGYNNNNNDTETYDIIYESLRPLDAEVAHIVCLSDLERKLLDTNQETFSRTKCELSPKLLNFILDHILKWYEQCLPKSSSNSSFLASVKKKQPVNDNMKNMSAEKLLEIFTENIECVQNSREFYQPSVLQTVSLCFQDLKEYLKKRTSGNSLVIDDDDDNDDDDIVLLSVKDDLDKSLLLPCVHKIFSCVKIMCKCDELKRSREGALLLSKALKMFDESSDDHLNEESEDLSPYKSLFTSCQLVFESLHEIYPLLPSIDNDVLPLLEAMEAIANLQKFARKESLNRKERVLDEDGEDSITDDQLVSIQLSQLCRRILEKNWKLESVGAGADKFKYKMGNLGWTLNLHLHHAKNSLDAVEYLVQDVLSQFLELDSPSDVVEQFPTMTKQSVPIFFVKLLESLVNTLRKVDFKNGNQKIVLFQLRKIAVHLQTVVSLTKSDSLVTVSMMTNVLKNMRTFVDIVNKNMEFFNACYGSKQEDVVSFFKALQTSTRQVHNICSYGKNEKKNSAIAGLVPGVKKSLEEFIYKVKGLLVANGSVEHFWAGNLKQRNLDGSEWKDRTNDSDSDYSDGDDDD